MTVRKTAKASEFYYGTDSFGRGVELARRESDGTYFVRFQGFNGYGVSYGKWSVHNSPVEHPTTTRNQYTGEVISFDSETSQSLVSWGFSTLRAGSPKGIRLPLSTWQGR